MDSSANPSEPALARARRLIASLVAEDDAPGAADEVESHLTWRRLEKGEVLCRQGTPSESMYFVVSGRLRVALELPDGTSRVLGDFGRGETIGEMGILTGEPRSATVLAARDTELLELPAAAFDRLVRHHPSVLLRLTREIVGRLRRARALDAFGDELTTIALVPLTPDVPIAELAERLTAALAFAGRTRRIGPEAYAAVDGAEERLPGWLDEQEAAHQIVLYQAEAELTPWSRRCLRQADRVVLVAWADGDPAPGDLERALPSLETADTAARQELVLLHRRGDVPPRGTAAWLAPRTLAAHHHVALDRSADVGRLARRLTGRAVGLVLGGGGARGFTHIGVWRALREHGVPIDLVGGTSIGSLISCQIAMGMDVRDMVDVIRRNWVSSNPMQDYTLPLVSLVTARKFMRSLESVFGDAQLEDLWTGCFCVSSSLTHGTVVVHQTGPLARAIRASTSVPGMAPPVSYGGELLIDGGVLNNLPADVMRRLSPRGPLIAVDVNPRQGLTASRDYGESLSAWQLLWSRFKPGATRLEVPGIHDVLERMTMLGSIQQSAEVVRTVDLFLHPPTDRFQMFDMKALDEIAEVGYRYAEPLVAEFAASHRAAWEPA